MKTWDWHYRVFFDANIQQQVHHWIQLLSAAQKSVYHEILEFYSSFYSFGILLDHIFNNPNGMHLALDHAEKNIGRIIQTPELLSAHYHRELNRISDADARQRLNAILEESLHDGMFQHNYWRFIVNHFGESAPSIISRFNHPRFDSYSKRPRQKHITSDHETLFFDFFRELTHHTDLMNRYGFCSIGDFETKISEGHIHGEWWDRELLNTESDRLILYKSNGAVKMEDYRYTIIHETYPGHGHFYNCIRNTSTPIDHGAMMLIEGWATYCEWNTLPSNYVEAIKHNAMVYLRSSHTLSPNDFATRIWKNKQKPHSATKSYSNDYKCNPIHRFS